MTVYIFVMCYVVCIEEAFCVFFYVVNVGIPINLLKSTENAYLRRARTSAGDKRAAFPFSEKRQLIGPNCRARVARVVPSARDPYICTSTEIMKSYIIYLGDK